MFFFWLRRDCVVHVKGRENRAVLNTELKLSLLNEIWLCYLFCKFSGCLDTVEVFRNDFILNVGAVLSFTTVMCNAESTGPPRACPIANLDLAQFASWSRAYRRLETRSEENWPNFFSLAQYKMNEPLFNGTIHPPIAAPRFVLKYWFERNNSQLFRQWQQRKMLPSSHDDWVQVQRNVLLFSARIELWSDPRTALIRFYTTRWRSRQIKFRFGGSVTTEISLIVYFKTQRIYACKSRFKQAIPDTRIVRIP